MSQNGQLARSHQVSCDGIEWQTASDFPELFLEREILPQSLEEVPPGKHTDPLVKQSGPPPLESRPGMPSLHPENPPGPAVHLHNSAADRVSMLPGKKNTQSLDANRSPGLTSRSIEQDKKGSGKEANQRFARKKPVTPGRQLLFVILGGLLALPTAQIILWQLGRDPLNLAPSFRNAGFPEILLSEPPD